MAQASTSRAQLAFMKEAAWAVIPGTVTLRSCRFTGESLAHRKRTVVSEEIRSDRQIPDLIEVGADAGGDTNFELSFGAYDQFLLGALGATDTDWTTPFAYSGVGTSGDVQFTAPSTIAASGATFTSLRVGQYIRVAGAANAANNGIFEVAARTTTTITVVETTLANENTSDADITASMIRNGAVEHSFLVEKQFGDLAEFVAYPGMEIGGLRLNVEAERIMSGTFSWLGQYAIPAGVTLDTAGGYDAATTADVMNATAHVGSIQKDGSAFSNALMQIEMAIDNGLAGRPAIGNKHAIGIRQGRFNMTGTLRAYFESRTLYEEMIDHGTAKLHWRVTDPAGNAYLFTIPRLRWSEGDPTAPGVDQDVFLPLSYQAVRDSVTDSTFQIDKLAA